VKPKAIYDDFDRVATMLARNVDSPKKRKKKQ
jgi:hypothetical protein